MTTTIADALLFIDNNVAAFYAISFALLLIVLWRLRRAQRELSRTNFELERERALGRRARIIDATVLIILFILAITAVNRVAAPYLRQHPLAPSRFSLTNYSDRFVTRVPGASSEASATPEAGMAGEMEIMEAAAAASPTQAVGVIQRATDIFSGEVEATFTPTSTPPGTLMADPPDPVGCADASALIAMPVNGQILYETIVVEGSANTAGFSAYQFQIKGPATDDRWMVLRSYTTPVSGGVLGQFDGSAFDPGVYQFRLAVVDNEDKTIASCTINIQLDQPPATATPIFY
jgi:hypothetical protein